MTVFFEELMIRITDSIQYDLNRSKNTCHVLIRVQSTDFFGETDISGYKVRKYFLISLRMRNSMFRLFSSF